jgi:hypothetical protein
MENKRIFSLNQIELACVIGSPIVAGILIYYNYKNFGDKQKGIVWIAIGIIWTLALFGIAMMIPDNIIESTKMVIPPINGLILYPIIRRLQGAKINEHFENKGEKGSNWLVAGLTIFVAALIVTPVILLNRISPITSYTRQAFESNGIYYNPEMPIDEVNKLGGILKRIQYFNPESPAEAVFIATDTTYEFKIITEKSFFDDKPFLTDIQQIFKHVGKYAFKQSITYKLTDLYLADDKIISLENYDSIPDLLETVLFTQNPNFILIYDISIEESERDKFQRLIVDMDKIFSPQKRFDFFMDYEDNNYFLRLFIPKQNWNSPQLLTEARFLKEQLNNLGFQHPFKLILMDNSTVDIEEVEI